MKYSTSVEYLVTFHHWNLCITTCEHGVYVPLVQEAGVPTSRRGELNNDVAVQENTNQTNKYSHHSNITEFYRNQVWCVKISPRFTEQSNTFQMLPNFYCLTYFVTLESVLYISFNLHEINLSWLIGEIDLLILITLKSSGATKLCREEDKHRQHSSTVTNSKRIVSLVSLGCVFFLRADTINGPRLMSKYFRWDGWMCAVSLSVNIPDNLQDICSRQMSYMQFSSSIRAGDIPDMNAPLWWDAELRVWCWRWGWNDALNCVIKEKL